MKNLSLTTLATVSLSLTGMMVFGNSAEAATMSQSFSANVPLSELSFTEFISLPQFNSSLGTLSMVKVDLIGLFQGDIGVENLSKSPSTFTLNVGAGLSLNGPEALNLTVNPLTTRQFSASAYDKTPDFGGTSGISYFGLTATDTNSITLLSSFSPYIGLGNILFTLDAIGSSLVSGGSSLSSFTSGEAGANITLTYEYITPEDIPSDVDPQGTPEPHNLLALVLVSGLGFFGKKKQKV